MANKERQNHPIVVLFLWAKAHPISFIAIAFAFLIQVYLVAVLSSIAEEQRLSKKTESELLTRMENIDYIVNERSAVFSVEQNIESKHQVALYRSKSFIEKEYSSLQKLTYLSYKLRETSINLRVLYKNDMGKTDKSEMAYRYLYYALLLDEEVGKSIGWIESETESRIEKIRTDAQAQAFRILVHSGQVNDEIVAKITSWESVLGNVVIDYLPIVNVSTKYYRRMLDPEYVVLEGMQSVEMLLSEFIDSPVPESVSLRNM